MKVQIEGNLYIESDSYGYQVKTITGTRIDEKTKKEVEISTTHGHFINVQGCADYLVNMKIKESKTTNLPELIADVKEIREWIKSVITF